MCNFARCFLLLAWLVAAQTPERSELDRVFAELARTTGFKIHRPVSFEVLSRDQVNRFMDARIKEAARPADIRAEELTLKKLGFVPADFDLRKTTLALLTEQTAAFYDYHRKRLYLTDWASASLRDAATVHEMAHALADQNYSLERYTRRVENDSEQSAARQAVVEGQASWLMNRLAERQPQDAAATTEQKSDEPFPVFDRAPLYLRETLTFPYTYGVSFQQAVYARLGKQAFREVFEHPPISTQQILHPELYFSNLRPETVKLPKIEGMKRLVEGPLGELEHSILLEQFTSKEDAREVSPHWRGAWYELWENRRSGRVALVYRSIWDTERNAQRYFALYKQILSKKLAMASVTKDSEGRFAGAAEDGFFSATVSGTVVTSGEGFAENQPLSEIGK